MQVKFITNDAHYCMVKILDDTIVICKMADQRIHTRFGFGLLKNIIQTTQESDRRELTPGQPLDNVYFCKKKPQSCSREITTVSTNKKVSVEIGWFSELKRSCCDLRSMEYVISMLTGVAGGPAQVCQAAGPRKKNRYAGKKNVTKWLVWR